MSSTFAVRSTEIVGTSPAADAAYSDLMEQTLAEISANETDTVLEPSEIDTTLTKGAIAWYIAYRTASQ